LFQYGSKLQKSLRTVHILNLTDYVIMLHEIMLNL